MTDPVILKRTRPTMRTSARRSLPLRSTLAFGLGGILATAFFFVEPPLGDLGSIVVNGLAVTAITAGMFLMVESAAIGTIRALRTSSREQLDELARATLYTEQIGEALDEVHEFRIGPQNADPMPLVNRLLSSASTRTSVAFDPSVRLYVVESTLSGHEVKARAGNEPFAIEVGKSCPADRSLEEVASTLAPFCRIAPVSIGGRKCSLVMLSNRLPGPADCSFVERLALVLSLADPRLGQKSQGRHRSQAKLRAV